MFFLKSEKKRNVFSNSGRIPFVVTIAYPVIRVSYVKPRSGVE